MNNTKSFFWLLAIGATGLLACDGERAHVEAELRNSANANPYCDPSRPTQARYDFVQAACPPSSPALVCYEGELTGGGYLSGDVFLEILDVGAGSYHGTSVITANQGTVSLHHSGQFVAPSPNPGDLLLQSDVAVVTGGTGRFESASGYFWNTGFAVPPGPGEGPFVTATFGETHGSLCLPL